MKKKYKKKKNKSTPRNGFALAAKSRVSGMAPMKDRRASRGGNKNKQKEFLEEYQSDKEENSK